MEIKVHYLDPTGKTPFVVACGREADKWFASTSDWKKVDCKSCLKTRAASGKR